MTSDGLRIHLASHPLTDQCSGSFQIRWRSLLALGLDSRWTAPNSLIQTLPTPTEGCQMTIAIVSVYLEQAHLEYLELNRSKHY